MPFTRKQTKKVTPTPVLASFFGVHPSNINRKIREGVRYDLVYLVLTDKATKKKLKPKQKRDYINRCSLSEYYKRTFINLIEEAC